MGHFGQLYKSTKEELAITNQGQFFRTSEGTFLCKIPSSMLPLIIVFIDVDAINIKSEENTVWYLTTDANSNYQAFECSIIKSATPGMNTWQITRGNLPPSFKKGEEHMAIIPFYAIIVPLAPDIFTKEKEAPTGFKDPSIVFTAPEWKRSATAIELPVPSGIAVDAKTLLEAIQRANCAFLNIKPIHGLPEIHQISQDHRIVKVFA